MNPNGDEWLRTLMAMSDHNENDDDDFVDDVLNADDHDDNEEDDDDNVNVQNDDTCHNTSGYCKTWDIGVNNK